MKRLLPLWILFCAVSAHAQFMSAHRQAMAKQTVAPASGCGFLFCEGFENWPANWTYTGSHGDATINSLWDLRLTTSSAPGSTITNFSSAGLNMSDSFVLKMSDPEGDFPTCTLATNLTAADSSYWVFEFRTHALVAAGNAQGYFDLLDSSGVKLCGVNLGAGNTLSISDGTSIDHTTDAVSADTTYDVYVRYTKGTGADSIASVAFIAKGGTRPTSGTAFVQVADGTSTGQAAKVRMTPPASAIGPFYVDHIRGNSTDLGSNPP